MKIYCFAEVTEYKISRTENVYNVNILKHEETIFQNKKDVISFLKHNALALLEMGQINSLSVKFKNKDNNIHYIIIEHLAKEKEPIVYEETEFEYMRINRRSFKKYARRRKIDDRNYSFLDIARAAINWSPNFNIMNLLLSIFALIISSIYIIFGLNFILKINHIDHSHNYIRNWVWQFMLFVPFIFSCSFAICFAFSVRYTNIQIKNASGDYQDVDWKIWFKIRLIIIRVVIFFSLISLGCISTFMYLSIHDSMSGFTNIGIISLCILGLICFTQIIVGLRLHYSISKNMKRYYQNLKKSTFRKWIASKSNNERRRSDTREFIFENTSSEEIVLSKMLAASTMMSKLDRNDIKKLYIRNKTAEKYIRKKYITLIKEVKNANFISKNNQSRN